MEIIAAILLSLSTLVLLYVAWYVLWRRHGKTRTKLKPAPGGDADGEDGSGDDWHRYEGSYCYPEINDILGWEFVHIQSVGPVPASPAGEGAPARRRNILKAVPLAAGQDAAGALDNLNEGNEIPEGLDGVKIGHADIGEETGTEAEEHEYNLFFDLPREDIEAFEEMPAVKWPESDPSDNIPDEVFNELINSHRDAIGEASTPHGDAAADGDGPEEDTRRLRESMRALESLDENNDEYNRLIDEIFD